MTLRAEKLPIHHNDETVVDAARVSFAKRSEMFTNEKNISLLKHLHKNGHWSPYGHAREAFVLSLSNDEAVFFFENAKLAGFSWIRDDDAVIGAALSARTLYFAPGNPAKWVFNGSLWAWHENIKWLPLYFAKEIATELWKKYPEAGKILFDERLIYFDPIVPSFAGHVEYMPDSAKYAKVLYASLRIRAPIWVARQLVKHQVHLCWNEESRRYITDEPTFYLPELRKKAENVKQGSLDEEIGNADWYKEVIQKHHANSNQLYRDLLDEGAAPEVARGVLPLNVETNWIWTGSLSAWDRVCRERLPAGAQKETRLVVEQIDQQLEQLYSCWKEIRQMRFPLENAPAWQL
jgi:thymidylate synthase (FAD)